MSFVLRTLALGVGDGGTLSLSGPVSVDEAGLLNGKLQIAVTNPAAVGAYLETMMPEQRNEIRSVMSGITMLGDNPALPLTISRGKARIAFITLGQIPPLR